MPTTSAADAGRYMAVVPAVAVAGAWRYRWTASAVDVGFADEGQFSVRPSGAQQIVDLPSVKAHLNIPASDTRHDAELQGFILAAADLARDVCGPLLAEQHTQAFDGGTSTIIPDWLPLASVDSAIEYYGLSAFELTEQPLDDQMNAFAFTVDYTTGQITRRTFGGEAALFAIGAKNIIIRYTAGAGTVPWTVRLGALELIRHLYQLTQQGGQNKFGGAGALDTGESTVPTGFALPSRVLELWQPFKRGPGIA